MNTTLIASVFGSSLLLIFLATGASGQAQRTFVSGLGDDLNPCTRIAPCRTFRQAISQTNAGGEIYVSDVAGYGPLTINKSVSVIAPAGVTAGISAFNGNRVTISAAGTDNVVLRGLTLNSQGGTNGIAFNSGGSLQIDNCAMNGFPQAGIVILGPGRIFIKDTVLSNNGFGIASGSMAGGVALVSIDHVQLLDNSNAGLAVSDGGIVWIRNSLASGNTDGYVGSASAVADSRLYIDTCVATGNHGTGILAFGAAHFAAVWVSNSTVTNNGTGLATQGARGAAIILTRGDDTVEGNTFGPKTGFVSGFTSQ